MPGKASDPALRKVEAIRIMVTLDFKRRVQEMCDDLYPGPDESLSSMTREFWADKLAIWEKQKGRR